VKIFKTFREFREAPSELYEYLMDLEKKSGVSEDEEFMNYYGGNFVVIESRDELKEISTTHLFETHEEIRWKNLLEESDSFDLCRWILENKWVEIMMCTTDAGGSTYFIPREIALMEPNVIASIELSKEIWKNADSKDINPNRHNT
jgi:hypothetical protein